MKKIEYIKENTILFRKCFNNGWIQPKKLRSLLFLVLFLVGDIAFSSKTYGMQKDEIEKKGPALVQNLIELARAWWGTEEDVKKTEKTLNKLFDSCAIQREELKKCADKKISCTSLNNKCGEKLDASSSKKINFQGQLQQCEGEKAQCELSKLEESNRLKIDCNKQLEDKISLLNDECSKKLTPLSLFEQECSKKLVGSDKLNTDLSKELKQCKSEKESCCSLNNNCSLQLKECSTLNRTCSVQLQQCEDDLSSLRTTCNTTFLLEKNNDFKNNILFSFKNENIDSMRNGAISSVLPEIIRDAVGCTRLSPWTEQLVSVARGCILAGMTYCNADSYLPAVGAAMTGIVIRRVSDELSDYLELTTQQKMALNIVTNFGPSLLFNPNFVFDYVYYIVGSGLSLEAYTQIKSFISSQKQGDGVQPEAAAVLAIGNNATNVAIQSLPLVNEEQHSPRKQTESPHKITEHLNNNYCNEDKSTTSIQLIQKNEEEKSNEAEKLSISSQRTDGPFPTVKDSSQPSLINSSSNRKDEHKPQVTRQSSEDFSNRYNREGLGIAIKKVNSANEK